MKRGIPFKVLKLPEVQRDRVHELLRQNCTYAEIQKALKEEFSVTIAASSLSRYYTAHSPEFLAPPPKQKEGGEPNDSALPAVHLHVHFDKREEAARK